MKIGFFSKLGLSNIRKNYRFFVPRILAEAGLLACFYISITLGMDERIRKIKGGDYLPSLMFIGIFVLSILSIIIMLYTNSFLMKQRKKEFGIYNMLGMEKRHVIRVLLSESIISCIVALSIGILTGIIFYKLCSLLICRLLQAEIILGLYFIKLKTIIPTALIFFGIDVLTFIINSISIARQKPIDLLSSKAQGEKEPKVKWVLFAIGLISLTAGYYIAVTVKNPLEALNYFLLAILLVMLGTYFLFVAGSIFVLKILKNNKKYYYNKKHMPAISGLLYRMKKNAVGLASIAILSTGVLVMISTTVSLYSGLQGTLESHYPQHLYVRAGYQISDEQTAFISSEELTACVNTVCAKNDIKIKKTEKNSFLSVSFMLKNGELLTNIDSNAGLNNLTNFIFITEENYTKLTGNTLGLSGNEVALARISTAAENIGAIEKSFKLGENTYNVKQYLSYFPISDTGLLSAFTLYGAVVTDNAMSDIYNTQKACYGKDASEFTEQLAVTFADIEKASEKGKKITDGLIEEIYKIIEAKPGYNSNSHQCSYSLDNYWEAKESLIGMYGTLLFLGILLGFVCIFATVLIIYFKQISEGYEDRSRFQIMQKIGMSRKEVGKTISRQVLLVFFLPLLTAGIHFCFAYPLLTQMLSILMLYKPSLFMTCSIITYAVFAVIYVIIYLRTSKTYYKIVR